MAFFKCKHFGAVFEFTADNDVESMRKHFEYEEVDKKAYEAYLAKTATQDKKSKKADSQE